MTDIKQILINLITNSIRYSINGGVIEIKIEINDSGEMIMSVSDQGIGIPKDRLGEAMQPFRQVHDPVQTMSYQGTGLGLPLAKAMVGLHQGEFRLDSEEGVGTWVTISFPKHRVRVLEHAPKENAHLI